MFKKTIKYVDYNGEERKEDFYFNLNKSELLEMQLSQEGGLRDYLIRIVDAKDTPELIKMFKHIILLAYGEKSDDGKVFMKSDEIRKRFECTEAYSELFMELATDSDAAAEFVNNLLPADYKADDKEMGQIKAQLAE